MIGAACDWHHPNMVWFCYYCDHNPITFFDIPCTQCKFSFELQKLIIPEFFSPFSDNWHLQCEDCGKYETLFYYSHRGILYLFCEECITLRKKDTHGLNPKLLTLKEIIGD